MPSTEEEGQVGVIASGVELSWVSASTRPEVRQAAIQRAMWYILLFSIAQEDFSPSICHDRPDSDEVPYGSKASDGNVSLRKQLWSA